MEDTDIPKAPQRYRQRIAPTFTAHTAEKQKESLDSLPAGTVKELAGKYYDKLTFPLEIISNSPIGSQLVFETASGDPPVVSQFRFYTKGDTQTIEIMDRDPNGRLVYQHFLCTNSQSGSTVDLLDLIATTNTKVVYEHRKRHGYYDTLSNTIVIGHGNA